MKIGNTEDERLNELRADIRVLRGARVSLKQEPPTGRSLRALAVLENKLHEKIVELGQLRGYEPRLPQRRPEGVAA